MEEVTATSTNCVNPEVPQSPRPTAFTIDFDDDKKIDLARHKTLTEKFKQRHKRGKSMSKLEATPPQQQQQQPQIGTGGRRQPSTGNLPRKSSFQSEGYFSSDERSDRCRSANLGGGRRGDLTLPLENVTTDRMTHSFPNAALLFDSPPICDLRNISSPEFDLISPFSPNVEEVVKHMEEIHVIEQNAFELQDDDKKSDTVSEAGTYTLDVEYSEEQKARMSIDNDFKIEKISVEEKATEYIKSLSAGRYLAEDSFSSPFSGSSSTISSLHSSFSNSGIPPVAPLKSHQMELLLKSNIMNHTQKVLSPILSPTQNISLIEHEEGQSQSPQKRPQKCDDEGAFISVTSSGAFRKNDTKPDKRLSLAKSIVHVEAYVDGKIYGEEMLNNQTNTATIRRNKLTANIVNVQSIEMAPSNDNTGVVSASLSYGRAGNVASVTTGCPLTPTAGSKSPSKIPSPLHSLSRPRSRNSLSALPDDFDTDTILKPTRNYIDSLQQKLSLDNSDQDSDLEAKYAVQLNNTAHLLKQRALHIRHNSLDDRINNKLEHFQNKQPIDQTFTNLFGQYNSRKVVNKINNSPSDSPIRRSSSFSNRNQINIVKSSNVDRKETNLVPKEERMQRSSSTACIKPGQSQQRSGGVELRKLVDRNQFGDTESSSEEDPNVQKRKDLGCLSNTRCNRTFSLRRARVDIEANKPKCPNTPEMRRKTFQSSSVKQERAISVDRKPTKTNEVQSRYLSSLNRRSTPAKETNPKKPATIAPKSIQPPTSNFARSEGGRFSMRTPKLPPPQKLVIKKRDGNKQKHNGGGARSNSSLSSREVEFQNWKRRKSYDPMKAAAEGKKKVLEKRMTGGTSKIAPSPDSSPSHSGSVHRSQSFHGTAALEQLISSDEDELTFSGDEGFSPPTPSPCELSPTKASLRNNLWDKIRN